jgi:hypothetical protein
VQVLIDDEDAALRQRARKVAREAEPGHAASGDERVVTVARHRLISTVLAAGRILAARP